MTIKVSSGKAKGRKLQQILCAFISKAIGIEWGSEDEKLIQSRPMGQKGVDVVLKNEALQKFPFSCECKWNEKWNVVAAIKQAKANTKPDTDWLLCYKKNHLDPIVILDAEVFFKLYAQLMSFKEF